jgi:hypothetical protein
MKKFTTAFGLLSLMLLLTSFTSPVEIGGRDRNVGTGNFEIGGRDRNVGTGNFEIGGRDRNVGTGN